MTISRQVAAPIVFVKGEVHSTDASGGVALTLYEEGSLTARTLAVDEYLVVEIVHLVTAAGGDSMVYFGSNGTPANGSFVLRGTFAANSGVALQEVYSVGTYGKNIYVKAPVGVVDVIFYGQIRKL